MSILKSEVGRKIVEQITLKSVKTGFGHDLCGLYADFFLNKEKIGYLNDDGWGGETDIIFVSPTRKKV